MTAEEIKSLRPGDIIEFRGEVAYWLFKLVKLEKEVWYVTNHGKELIASSIVEYPEDCVLLGHSDYQIKRHA